MRLVALLCALAVAGIAATAVAAPTAAPDFAVTIKDSPDPVRIGQRLTYTIAVRNHGDAAGQAELDWRLFSGPEETPPFIVAGSGARCLPTTAGMLCQLEPLSPGAGVSLTVRVTPRETGDYEAEASVASTADTHGDDNSAVQKTLVAPRSRPGRYVDTFTRRGQTRSHTIRVRGRTTLLDVRWTKNTERFDVTKLRYVARGRVFTGRKLTVAKTRGKLFLKARLRNLVPGGRLTFGVRAARVAGPTYATTAVRR